MKRRRGKLTDYKQRLILLRSNKPRIVVRRTHNYIQVQIVEYDEKGDRSLLGELSKNLNKYGWKGHCGNVSAAYLTGVLAGAKAVQKGIKEAVLDIGLQTSVKGSSLYAVVKGAVDAGLKIPVNEKIIPSADRIVGKHIANYADKLKKEDEEKYKKQFSLYLKAGIEPEKLPDHFEQVKKKIIDELKITKSEAKREEEWEDVE